jgi:diguanylate cyclase (GGDEF)-like protein
VSEGLWAAVAAGIVIGFILARVITGRRGGALAPFTEDGRPSVPDVADLMRQMLSASGRRAMVPVILKLVDELLEPEQVAVFVTRPDGKLALADGKGLPESLARGAEVEAEAGMLHPPSVAGLRVDAAAPIMADQKLRGFLCLGGARRRRGSEQGLVTMVADLSGLAIVQVEKIKAIQDTANVDGLTSVFNKRHFQERLAEEMRRAQRDGTGLSLLLLDIDHFKNYNDTNGHVAGDDVLKKMGQILKNSVREDDVVARYGGEEFVILYPGASKALAYRLAQSLRRAVESQHFPGGERQPLGAVTISGGVAAFPQDATSEVELIRAADQALYQAKKAGRNRIIGAGASDPSGSAAG